jgi:hypothetical protein
MTEGTVALWGAFAPKTKTTKILRAAYFGSDY